MYALDIDECQVDNGNCTELCVNRPGNYSCKYNELYHLYKTPVTGTLFATTSTDLTLLYYILPISAVISKSPLITACIH